MGSTILIFVLLAGGVSYFLNVVVLECQRCFQISAQHFNNEVCDKKVLMDYETYTCNCNNYEYLFERKKICESRCNEPDNISQNCCEAKCVLLENFISNDGNFNKTAMALFY